MNSFSIHINSGAIAWHVYTSATAWAKETPRRIISTSAFFITYNYCAFWDRNSNTFQRFSIRYCYFSETLILSPQSSFLRQRSHLTPPELNWATVQRCLLNFSKMKHPIASDDNKQKKRRKTLHSLCSVLALLLSVVCCMALIHVELRIQEHHRLISHSVTIIK